MSRSVVLTVGILTLTSMAWAQLPPDAVDLGRVKISEKQKSQDLCPVHLDAADPTVATWEHNGVTYGGTTAECQAEFLKDPDKYASAAEMRRWENNFVEAMSTIWCPVTDEVTSGGGLLWDVLDIKWESCCQFCNDSKSDEDFPRALDRLKKRAAESFEKTNGTYVEGASSPVEGAIDLGGGFGDEETAEADPQWMAGLEVKATWNEGIGLLFENRCVECHRPGGLAPMPYITYGSLSNWKAKMKDHITLGTMPPWPADSTNFANSKRLTKKEKDLFLEWIDAKYPKGDGAFKMDAKWTSEWVIGEPDHVFELGEYTLAEDLSEHVAEYEIKTDFAEDRWVSTSQVKPTSDFLVLSIDAGPLGSYHVGNGVTTTSDSSGFLLKKGETVKVRVFYTKEAGWEEIDDMTQFGVKFSNRPAGVTQAIVKDRMANDSFTIPAGKDDATVTAEFTFPADGHVISLTPVMRFRGKTVTATVVFPDGKEEQVLSIPYWDPMLHLTYRLPEPLAAPKGTVVRIVGGYDNSDMNARNPDSTVEVKAGPGGELLEGWLGYSLVGS